MMAKNNQRYGNRSKSGNKRQSARAPLEPPRVYEPKPVVEYGQPFMLLEDVNKNTFEYVGGSWVPHEKNIAECRVDCLVKELPQRVNKMIRYEVRRPIGV